ncbi:MAG TPA: gluconeogenesis factor YvcK family protein [Patescibacteria group bacterium]|nr:gluconeogenesis factor YvcK family protein [Patescibacteria group bacterium]
MQKKKIVTIGGGTGSFMLLSGLKKYPVDLSAIVSMADDGGSTGVLRDELGVLPPGDVRQCLVALSDSTKTMRDLMNYRFEEGGLKGHNFGNILLSALEKITGSFSDGVTEATKILTVKGSVIPVTNQKAHLCIALANRKILDGENVINHSVVQKSGVRRIYFAPSVKPNPRALAAIKNADIIVIGPGNLYCSILPNLIIGGIATAIKESRAKVIYNPNLVNKKGHTEGFDVDDYVNSVERYIGKGRIDYVLYNTKRPQEKLLRKYEKQEGSDLLVGFDDARNPSQTYKLIRGMFIQSGEVSHSKADVLAHTRSLIRHDADKLARTIVLLADAGDIKDLIKELI